MANQVLGAFELEEQLGAGGMGVVYKARYVKTGQRVALKLLSPTLANDQKLVARFQRELDILKKLKHPNIVQCYGGGRLGQQRFYAMELVEGGSLAQLLKARTRIGWEETIQYGLQICSALEHAHENGIIHRDLKPANLMLDKNGQIKLADFGLARVTDATALTAAGKTLGTFAYMAPEQITGKSPISHKTDLYAFGCVLCEFLTGNPPFQSDTAAELFYAHLKKKPPRVSAEVLDCPIWLENIVLQLLEKDPDKRPRDALAVAQSLKEVTQKMAENVSVAQHSLTGEPTTLNIPTNTQEVGTLFKKKKKKKRDKNALFYEQTWFLVTSLLFLIALVTWSFWPMSEAALFKQGSALMAGDDETKWLEARDKFLIPLSRRFPQGKYASEVQEYLDRIEMNAVEKKLKKKIKRGDDELSEAERLFAVAWRYEQFGDRITAVDKYNALIHVLKDRKEDRPFVKLAKKQIAELEDGGGKLDDRLKIVDTALERADKAYVDGKVQEARSTWQSIISLYGDNRELEPQVKRAQARLFGPSESKAADADSPPKPPNPTRNLKAKPPVEVDSAEAEIPEPAADTTMEDPAAEDPTPCDCP